MLQGLRWPLTERRRALSRFQHSRSNDLFKFNNKVREIGEALAWGMAVTRSSVGTRGWCEDGACRRHGGQRSEAQAGATACKQGLHHKCGMVPDKGKVYA